MSIRSLVSLNISQWSTCMKYQEVLKHFSWRSSAQRVGLMAVHGEDSYASTDAA